MTSMARLHLWHSMRMQTDTMMAVIAALIAEEETALAGSQPQPDPEACPNCGAPAEKQVDASVMGEKKTMCLVCRQERAA
jgi:hypothetical protein